MKTMKSSLLLIIMALLITYFSSCKKEDDKMEAKIEFSKSSGIPGDTIIIDGSQSIAPSGANFIFTFENVQPENFEVINSNDNKKKTVIFKKSGNCTVKLRIEFNGMFSEAQKQISISGAKKLSENINTPTTLTDLLSVTDYYVDKIIEVTSQLTIDDNVSIEFAQNAGFIIKDGASITIGNGTGQSIVFDYAGSAEDEGWKGVFIRNGKLIISGVFVVNNAGYGAWDNGVTAAIVVDTSGKITRYITGAMVFSKSGSYDLVFTDKTSNSSSDGFRELNISFSAENETVFKGYFNHVASNPNMLSINDKYFEIIGGTYDFTGSPLQLYNSSGKLYFTGDMDIKLSDGISFQLGKVFMAQGKSIVLTGNQIQVQTAEFAGYNGKEWKGIYITSNGSQACILNNIKVKDAGWRESGSSEISAAVSSSGYLNLQNCSIENTHGYGLYSTGSTIIASTTFSNCAKAGAGINYHSSVQGDNIFILSPAVPGIELFNVDGTGNSSTSYSKLNGSYYFINDFLSFDYYTTISAGSVFKVGEGYSIFIRSTFNAVGTPTDSIIFEGKVNTPGFWNGISVNLSSFSNPVTIDYCRISDAGSGFLPSEKGSSIFAAQKANIAFFSVLGSAGYFMNSKITGSNGYGVYIHSGVGLDGTYLNDNNISFSNNLLGDYYKQ